MINCRYSADAEKNDKIAIVAPRPKESNEAWLKRTGQKAGLVFLGGSSLTDFRLRIAQSHLRSDLLPSFWSVVGILAGDKAIVTVPLHSLTNVADIPSQNAIRHVPLREFTDPTAYPNIAVIRFTADSSEKAVQNRLKRGQKPRPVLDRTVVDLPSLVVRWLAFVWGADKQGNPLLEGYGIPNAAMVEALYGLVGIDLTPGLAATASCPEAIWQAAIWWKEYYEKATAGTSDGMIVPEGVYALRQPAAAVEG